MCSTMHLLYLEFRILILDLELYKKKKIPMNVQFCPKPELFE